MFVFGFVCALIRKLFVGLKIYIRHTLMGRVFVRVPILSCSPRLNLIHNSTMLNANELQLELKLKLVSKNKKISCNSC